MADCFALALNACVQLSMGSRFRQGIKKKCDYLFHNSDFFLAILRKKSEL